MGPRIITYKNDVRHIVGESFTIPCFMRNGAIRSVTWVATDATYVSDWNKTYVEFDRLTQESAVLA